MSCVLVLFFIYYTPRDLLLVDHLNLLDILVRIELRLCRFHFGNSFVEVGGGLLIGGDWDWGLLGCGITHTRFQLLHLLLVFLLELLHNLGSGHFTIVKENLSDKDMKILAIDIGYHNMGIVLADSDAGPKIRVEYVKKVSLSDYKYIYSNDIVDLVPLFVEDHKELFDSAEKILIERQPPGGFTNVEILLHYMFKDKVSLISPVSMHTHFGMRHLNYDQRKERTVSIAEKYIEDEIPYERKHDIADALCMIVYHNFRTMVHFFDTFKFSKRQEETQGDPQTKGEQTQTPKQIDLYRHFC